MSMKSLFRRKTLDHLQGGDDTAEGPQLKKVLTARSLISMGVAGIIGTGLFVLTGPAILNVDHPELSAGPSIILSFILCGLALLLVAFAFGELSALIPASGSSYTYVYATLGELPAWIIGWDLILEYAFGASAVAVGWSSYLQGILAVVGIHLPDYLSHAPKVVPWGSLTLAAIMLTVGVAVTLKSARELRNPDAQTKGRGRTVTALVSALVALACGGVMAFDVFRHLTSIDLCAIGIVVALNFLLVKGMEHTAKVTNIFVVVKLAVIALFVMLGIWHFDAANLHPFLPNGLRGMMAGAGAIFFAFIGFDALTCHAEECRDPQNDMKWGILGSLGISTFVYVLVAVTIIGAVSWTTLAVPGQPQQEGAAFITILHRLGYDWAVPVLAVGVIASITSVLLLSLSSQARIMMRMSKDGLVVPFFSKVHPQYQTPYRSIWSCGAVIALLAALLPIGELAELTSIGTLAAFVLVCVGVIVLRKLEPDRPRKFRCPDAPFVPLLLGVAGGIAAGVMQMNGVDSIWVLVSGGVAAGSLVLWLLQRFFGIPWIPAGGAAISLALMLSLPWVTWVRFIVWLGLGAGIYFIYGRYHSKLRESDDSKK